MNQDDETTDLQKYAQEAEMKWQRCGKFYETLKPATIAPMQVLMGVSAYASESLRSGVQDIFKELDNGQDMTVSEVSKKLHSLAQIEEAKETLHKSNGFKKKKGEFVLGVTSAKKTV